jgi:hypothetical protein
VAARLRFLEDRRTVPYDLEASAARWNQRDLGVWKTLSDLGRQTDGPGLVASDGAVLDRDFHGRGAKV